MTATTGQDVNKIALAGGIPEIDDYDDGQTEELVEEIRDELAVRGNGIRR